jgi:hypothetical protein
MGGSPVKKVDLPSFLMGGTMGDRPVRCLRMEDRTSAGRGLTERSRLDVRLPDRDRMRAPAFLMDWRTPFSFLSLFFNALCSVSRRSCSSQASRM